MSASTGAAARTRRNGTRPTSGVAAVPVTRRDIVLHGNVVSFLEAGATSGGPVVVLLHGLASSALTWEAVLPLLGRHCHVIAPDLLGHGRSAKPGSGDYSLGAYAAEVRDLLLVLGLDRATVIGHSFGGGVAMQYAHQFPELVERVGLVSSGGLGSDVTPALRAATLPGANTVLRAVSAITPAWLGRLGHRLARLLPGADVDGVLSAFDTFADSGARGAFVHTVRGSLDGAGQRLAGTDRLYLLDRIPVLLVGGSRDPVIPVEHTRAAHVALPDSRLEIFDGGGHFPHIERARRFADLVEEFVTTTTPARADLETLRRRLREASHEVPAAD
ncbi:alpha/beta fold hydrolase [Pseudonocardia endophytica]|uniref:Pimeloyl-ACP methyl ester carboxylesterase n=1 Tax=Pseudonocardia endophytica TaxID=401976 RepID=A0A4R1HTU9_PSEEN|nr:alpha/beta hydrolase [Pseudonocardia endophytica]TCK24763.1 pimeloyl-ACP methyl ester carboxylesterase [Pseudonocardia endophytica]